MRLLVGTVRFWMWLVWGMVFTATSALAVPSKGVRFRVGENGTAALAELRLKSGRLRFALELATQCLADDPVSAECLSVKVRAASGMGHCNDLMPSFESLRTTDAWTARTATAEAICWLRLGRLADAEVALDEAHALKPKMAAVLFQMGMLAGRRGDVDRMDEVAAELSLLDDSAWMVDVLEGWRMMIAASPASDGLLWMRSKQDRTTLERPAKVQFALLDCLRWLQVDDPTEADRSAKLGIEIAMHQPRLVACRGEALRRMGHVVEAEQLLTRPWNIHASSAVRDAALARLWVDVDQLEKAARLVGKAGDTLDPDQVAAAWYLARALGQTDVTEQLKVRYALRRGVTSPHIESFVPWTDLE